MNGKKNINIVSCHKYLTGSFLNILDLQQFVNGQENCNAFFHTISNRHLAKVVKNTLRAYSFFEIRRITKSLYLPGENVVTDFFSLIELYRYKIPVVCNKIVVLDNVELSYHLMGLKNKYFYKKDYQLDLMLRQHRYADILFLMPPVNHSLFKEKYEHYKSEVFFKKINVPVLKTIKTDNNGLLFFRCDKQDISSEIKNKYDTCIKIKRRRHETVVFNYSGYVYYKRKRLSYFEQLGRLVFEFILLGKQVFFLEDPLLTDDGLKDYLLHYEIKIKNNKVITEAEELGTKMLAYHDAPWE